MTGQGGDSRGITEAAMFAVWLRAARQRQPREAVPGDIEDYLALRPSGDARRRGRLIRQLRAEGASLDAPPSRRPRPGQAANGCLSPAKALEDVPVDAVTWGIRDRRDAALLALLCLPAADRAWIASLTRKDMRIEHRALAGDVGEWPTLLVRDEVVPTAQPSRACPACALTLWLGCLDAEHHGGRGAVLRFLQHHHLTWRHGHLCEDPRGLAGLGRRDDPLIVGVDRHGWLATTPLSPRQISRVLTRYRLPTHTHQPELTPRPHRAWTRTRDLDLESALDRLEVAVDAATERLNIVLERIDRA
ncbi:MAG: hypothetical protein Q4G34_01045 [Micrococcus sp.]|nr:hypothetical protein [Micrococcus sp.]